MAIKTYITSIPATPYKATIHFLHGIIEEVDNYKEMTNWFTSHGYRVIRQMVPWELPGQSRYPDEFEYNHAIMELMETCHTEKDGKPYFLMGFSMGSFLVRHVVGKYAPKHLSGVILIGSGWQNTITCKIGCTMAKHLVKKYGPDNLQRVADGLALENYAKHFKDESDDKFCWLYKDTAIRNQFRRKYMDNVVTPRLFYNLTYDMVYCSNPEKIRELKNQPLYLMSGENDPVTGNLYKVQNQLEKKYQIHADICSVPEGRHAILTDTGKIKVWETIAKWTDSIIERKKENE